jgi:hypothetical protein
MAVIGRSSHNCTTLHHSKSRHPLKTSVEINLCNHVDADVNAAVVGQWHILSLLIVQFPFGFESQGFGFVVEAHHAGVQQDQVER